MDVEKADMIEAAARELTRWVLGVAHDCGRPARPRGAYVRRKPSAKGFRRGPYAARAGNGGSKG